MDGLVEDLLRLERAKHKALVAIDAPAYDESVREQMRLLSETKGAIRGVADIEPLLVLSRLISLNARLLQNLLLTAPFFALGLNGYTASGRLSLPSESGRVMVEA